MSRIAKNSIKIPEGTSCNFDNNILTVKGKNGENTFSYKLTNLNQYINFGDNKKILYQILRNTTGLQI